MTRDSKRKLVIAAVGVLCVVVLAVFIGARANPVSGAPPGAPIDVTLTLSPTSTRLFGRHKCSIRRASGLVQTGF